MSLESYFKLNFALMQYHKYSLTEIENMMPWERDIYVGLLQAHLEEEQLKQRQKNANASHQCQSYKNNFDFNDTTQVDQSFKLIASCIDKIYTEDEVWASEDCTKKEMNDFLESMNSAQFKEIEKFFTTMPKLSHTIKVTNPETKVESDVVLEGLASFFGQAWYT